MSMNEPLFFFDVLAQDHRARLARAAAAQRCNHDGSPLRDDDRGSRLGRWMRRRPRGQRKRYIANFGTPVG
jgi:hypothetical protein